MHSNSQTFPNTFVERIAKIFEAFFLRINADTFHKDMFDVSFIKMEYCTIDVKEKIFTLKNYNMSKERNVNYNSKLL